ncbi:hypothetical protein BN439_3239 [Erwinia amylovora Ea644]|uniref:hypothetical protein n=1 Tax=Erwinia amylovora TaxID=552 RepID=UPI0002CB63F0|nr:hypothetical protein [Erwinia amylovora]CCP04273.1 hypothetical protein BN439_3239 [Erwinia amylovora Ea644]
MSIKYGFDFPLKSPFTQEEVQQRFWKCLYTSADQQMLHYWVVLPHRVQPAELTPLNFPEVGLTNIGRYITNDESPYLEVWAAYQHCRWEMNASDWLFNRLDLMGEKVLHQRIIDNPSGSGSFADVLTLKTHGSGDEVISRYTVQKDYNPKDGGGNYFLLKASCAAHDYAALASDIFAIVVSWDLLHRSNLATAELLTSVDVNKTSSFKIPASWKAKGIADNRLVIEHTLNDINYGVLNICFYPKERYQSPNEVYRDSTARFHQQDNGITLDAREMEIVANEVNEASSDVLYTCTGEIFSVTENMRAYYHMVIFKQADLWCYAELVGKHKNHKDYRYEENKRCLELFLSTIKMIKQ